ncbi:hypothetical protein RclHR1_10310001 [Rhizophagus clarus]|uniref:Uncharacterized protein n=1 Tax=Rhizophagus clarus TaxID=94130 RepID=A0A2Z6QSB7_9GLOM|nr:hypothetical protein RclHR1_10310001 [Rhizophagus clarus]GES87139.1 hypothetical protein GLOIN_2v1485256 [Rhizophagus clarus]
MSDMSVESKSLKSPRRLRDSEELKSIRHQRALELLQKPGMRESFRAHINLSALKEFEEAGEPFEEDDEILAYLEYKKREDHKNDVNFRSTGEVTRQRSIGTGGRASSKGDKRNVGDMFGVHSNNSPKTRKESPQSTSKDHRIASVSGNNKYSDKKFRSDGISFPVNVPNRHAKRAEVIKSPKQLHKEKLAGQN